MAKTRTNSTSKRQRFKGLKEGWRSGLEKRIGRELRDAGVPAEYEPFKIEYDVPARKSTYTPDFVLPNGIIIETKGRFVAADRKKHLWIKDQRPDLDIRFVFQNPNNRLYKGSPTTYAAWCEKYGFQYAAKSIPEEWISE